MGKYGFKMLYVWFMYGLSHHAVWKLTTQLVQIKNKIQPRGFKKINIEKLSSANSGSIYLDA